MCQCVQKQERRNDGRKRRQGATEVEEEVREGGANAGAKRQ